MPATAPETRTGAPASAGGSLLGGYLTMLRIREFELAAIEGHSQKHVLGTLHPYIGQEAIATGMCAHLRRNDLLLSTHRGHGHCIAKGAPVGPMMSELFGRENGLCGGKGGSMHVADFDAGMLGANGVVGANIVLAAGAAHEIKRRRDDRVVVCFFGDGAMNRGPFLEGLNWARVFDLPVIFVCEDNRHSASTRTSTMTGGDGAGARARSIGLMTIEVDGNSLPDMLAAGAEAVSIARAGEGPVFVHARTFRLTGHTATDAAAWRDSEEVEERWSADPLPAARELLLSAGCDEDALAAEENRVRDEVQAAYDQALAAPYPRASRAFEDVQDVGDPRNGAF